MAIRTAKLGRITRVYGAKQIPQGELDILRWFVNLRYRVAFPLLLVITATYLLGISPFQGTVSLLGLNLFYLITTYAHSQALSNNPSEQRVALVRQLQLPENLLICTLAVYLTGGVLTPMTLSYPVVIIESIILTDPRGVYRTGIAAVLLYCGLSVLEANHLIPFISGHWGAQNFYDVADAPTYVLRTIVAGSLILVTAYMGTRIANVISRRNLQIKHQLQDLHTLYDISKGLGNIHDEDEMLRYLATTLKTLQNATTCVISMVNKEGRIQARAGAGVAESTLLNLNTLNRDTSGLHRVFQKGEPLVIENIEEQPEYKPLLINPGAVCAYVFPIKSDTDVIGAISLTFDQIKHLTHEYSTLLTTIAAQAAGALQRAQLFTGTERMAREMRLLYDVGLYTGSTLSQEEVIRRTAGTLENLLSPDAYYIALHNAETNVLSFEVFMECGTALPKTQRTVVEGGLTWRIVQTCKPLLIHDWTIDGRDYNDVAIKTDVDMFTYLGVPMIVEDKVVGVLSVQSQQPKAFNSHHENLLTALAAQAAMSLENARLHQLAQDQAKLDSLTKVYNHGYFVELVRRAVEQSDQDDSCVALIMLDIDHFKKYNDTYGHVAGDNVLRMVANALKSSVRETDYVGRWGGEEFCVLLTGAGLQEAKKVARFIRRAISELYPVDGQGQLIPNPTVSQGISSYPFPSMKAGDLIEQADTALYQAKRQGRNQLIVYEAKGVLIEATTPTGPLPNYVAPKAFTHTTDNLLSTALAVASAEETTTTPKLS